MSAGEGDGQQSSTLTDETTLWRTLAAAGPMATAEALSDSDFDRLHVAHSVEAF